jgi:hypothetical protein
MNENFKKIINILKNNDFNNSTTENKVLLEIDKLLENWPIDNIKTKDDFIRFLFNIYFYKSKYRPFVSYLEIFYRYYLIVLIIILIIISLIWGLIYNREEVEFYKNLWIILSNVTYSSFIFYIPIRLYWYIRKLLRNEIKKNLLKTIIIWIFKIILFYIFIAFTWFIWTFIASILDIIGLAVYFTISDLK